MYTLASYTEEDSSSRFYSMQDRCLPTIDRACQRYLCGANLLSSFFSCIACKHIIRDIHPKWRSQLVREEVLSFPQGSKQHWVEHYFLLWSQVSTWQQPQVLHLYNKISEFLLEILYMGPRLGAYKWNQIHHSYTTPDQQFCHLSIGSISLLFSYPHLFLPSKLAPSTKAKRNGLGNSHSQGGRFRCRVCRAGPLVVGPADEIILRRILQKNVCSIVQRHRRQLLRHDQVLGLEAVPGLLHQQLRHLHRRGWRCLQQLHGEPDPDPCLQGVLELLQHGLRQRMLQQRLPLSRSIGCHEANDLLHHRMIEGKEPWIVCWVLQVCILLFLSSCIYGELLVWQLVSVWSMGSEACHVSLCHCVWLSLRVLFSFLLSFVITHTPSVPKKISLPRNFMLEI